MRIQYLGTAAAEGWPGMFCDCPYCEAARAQGGKNIRSRSQSVVYDGEDALLIDFPPDTYMHCLQHGLRLDKLHHLIITHSHNDHFAAPELQYRMAWYAPKRDFPLHLYGNDAVGKKYRAMLEQERFTEEQLDIEFHCLENFETVKAGKFSVTALPANHARYERCLMYLIECGGKQILYAHDTGIFKEETWAFLKGKYCNLVSLDCNNGSNREGTNHMGLPDAADVKGRLAEMGCIDDKSLVIVNHFSHFGTLLHDELDKAAQEHGMCASYDGAVWDL